MASRSRRGPAGHGVLDYVSGFAELIQHGLDAGGNFPTGSLNERTQKRKLLVGHGCTPPSPKAEGIAPGPTPNQSHCVNGCDDPCELWHRLRSSSGPARDRRNERSLDHMPLEPRAMAAMPVRETSARPSSVMIEMNCSILELRPVISNTKCSVEASITLARKMPASRKASMRFSPVPTTLISASSRSNGSPTTVRSTTRCTLTNRSSWLLICPKTIGVPVVTIVKRERCFWCSVSETVRLSML